MTDKQYLEAVYSAVVSTYVKLGTTPHNLVAVEQETERRLVALEAQEDNIKSEMWEDKK